MTSILSFSFLFQWAADLPLRDYSFPCDSLLMLSPLRDRRSIRWRSQLPWKSFRVLTPWLQSYRFLFFPVRGRPSTSRLFLPMRPLAQSIPTPGPALPLLEVAAPPGRLSESTHHDFNLIVFFSFQCAADLPLRDYSFPCDPLLKVSLHRDRRSLRRRSQLILGEFQTDVVRHESNPKYNVTFQAEVPLSDYKVRSHFWGLRICQYFFSYLLSNW